MITNIKTSRIVVSGKRKTAIARAIITEGTGKITINKKDYKNLQMFHNLKIREPIEIAKKILGRVDFDIEINVKGGGENGQIDAARLALSRAIIKFTNSKELEDAFYDYDRTLLIADIRRKEACKPGDSKARSKRQTSYR